MKRALLVLACVVATAALAVWTCRPRGERSGEPLEDLGRARPSARERDGEALLSPGADDGSGSEGAARSEAGASQEPRSAEVATEGGAAFLSLLARIRDLVPRSDFHALAWPLVVELGQGATQRDDRVERLRSLATSPAEPARFRAACLLGLALTGEAGVPAVLLELRLDPEPEVERAAWLSTALSSEDGRPRGLAISPAAYPSWYDIPTWPVEIERRAAEPDLRDALRRLDLPAPPQLEEIGGLEIPSVREECFCREVILVSTLGPGAGRDGDERDHLLRYLTETSPRSLLLQDAAAWCLAKAAREDPRLADRLIEIAGSRLDQEIGIRLLGFLATEAGEGERVLHLLRTVLSRPTDAQGVLRAAMAMETLTHFLGSVDGDLRREALDLAVSGILDPAMDDTSRIMFLNRLSVTAPDVLADVGEILLATEGSSEVRQLLVLHLGAVPQDRRPGIRDTIITSWGAADEDLRRAMLKALASFGDPRSLDFLDGIAATSGSEALRQRARELLGERSRK